MNAQNSGTMRGRFKRRRLPSTLGQHINDLLDDAAALRSRRDIDAAWMLLEDAHVLSQPWVRPHLRVHMAMLSLGWSQRNRSEVVGQLGRLIVAGPGSAFGRYPVGNTGRAAVSAFEPMPIRDDLALLLDDPEPRRKATRPASRSCRRCSATSRSRSRCTSSQAGSADSH